MSEDENGRKILVDRAKTSTSRRPGAAVTAGARCGERHPSPAAHAAVVPCAGRGLLNLDHFRSRKWAPAIEAGGIRKPTRIYDLRSTFTSRALAARVQVFELAKVMGTSVRMIERHYGTLLDGVGASIASRLNAYDAEERHDAAGEQR